MEITVNDIRHTMPDDSTVANLLDDLGEEGKGTAVAVNGKVVRKNSWAETKLKQGDVVLIIKAAYGG